MLRNHRDDIAAPTGYRALRTGDDDLYALAGRLPSRPTGGVPSRPEHERDDRSLPTRADEILPRADVALVGRHGILARGGSAPSHVVEVGADLVDPPEQRRRRPCSISGYPLWYPDSR